MRRLPRRVAAILIAGALAVAGCSPPAPIDILFISIDSTRADALTFRDSFATPRMTAFAERGTVFTNAISGSSWTLPAHAQMFTGTPPLLHGVQYDDVAIDPLTPTLPELLKAEGYFTAGFWTGWYLAGEYGFQRGFDVYENSMSDGAEIERQYRQALKQSDHDLAKRVLGGRDRLSHQDVTSQRVVERIEATLRRAPTDRGLFLFAHFFDPHYDFVPPAPWDTAFDPDYEGDFDGRNFYLDKRIFDPSKTPRRQIGERDLEHLIALYQGEIGWTDAAVGKILDLLAEHRDLDNTLVIITSDHGDEFFEHGGRGHRHTLFDELLHVPLLVRLPAALRSPSAPASFATQVSLSDLLPTILDASGIAIPAEAYGRSLLPALGGAPLPRRPTVSSLTVTGTGPGGSEIDLLLDSVRTEDYKLIRRLRFDEDSEQPRVLEALYFDLANDPLEHAPIINDLDDQRVVRAEALLNTELVQLRRHWDKFSHSPGEERSTNVSSLFESELDALGYSGDDGDSPLASPGFAMPWGTGPYPPPTPLGGADDE